MSLPNGFLEELRARASLTAIVGRKVTWDRRKSNPGRGDWWAPCPFHQEKSASFHVVEGQGFYKCFGCGASGDAISFLREMENLSFMEAVEQLAEEAGMQMPARDPAAAKREEARKSLTDVAEAAAKWFAAQLSGGRAEAAREYLKGRGMTGLTAKTFGVGFAPDDRDGLQSHLAAKGVPVEDMIAAGVLAKSDDGRVYPRFRDRIMFPIRDPRGRCISFGGRAMQKDARAKYLNGPETTLFDKSRNLYNADKARAAAGRAGRVIVAEGYMDVIALAQAGFEEAVAPLGTAVTEPQLQMIWRMSSEAVIALDGDAAGLKAAYRVIDLALPHIGPDRSLRFCIMPDGLDPDDLIRERGREAMEEALAGALPLVEMLWRRETDGKDFEEPEKRAALDLRLNAAARAIQDRRLRRHYVDALMARRNALFGLPASAAPSMGSMGGAMNGSGMGQGGGMPDPGPWDAPPPAWDAAPGPWDGPPPPDDRDFAPHWDEGPAPWEGAPQQGGGHAQQGFSDAGAGWDGAPARSGGRAGQGGGNGNGNGGNGARRGGDQSRGRGGKSGGRGGFGLFGAPPGPAPETAKSTLARIAASGAAADAAGIAARLRESAIVAGMLAHPAAALALEDQLAEAPFDHADLSRIRDAAIDALAEAAAGEDGAIDAGAYRAAVDARFGGDAWAAAGADRAVALTRALRRGAPAEAALAALSEALDRHVAILSAREEMEDAARSLLEGEAGEDLTHRLAALARAREGAGARFGGAAGEEDDAEAARRLRDFPIRPRSGRKG